MQDLESKGPSDEVLDTEIVAFFSEQRVGDASAATIIRRFLQPDTKTVRELLWRLHANRTLEYFKESASHTDRPFGQKSWDAMLKALKGEGIPFPISQELYVRIYSDKCPVCGSTDSKHDQEMVHSIYVSSRPGEPVAGVIEVQRIYNDPYSVARRMAAARVDLKKYFPDKKFEIQPSRLMLTKRGENSKLLGEAHIADYIFFEV